MKCEQMDRNARNRFLSNTQDLAFVPRNEEFSHVVRDRMYSLSHIPIGVNGPFFGELHQRSSSYRPILSPQDRQGNQSLTRKRSNQGRNQDPYRNHEPGNKRRRGESAIISVPKVPSATEIRFGKLSEEVKECSQTSEQSRELLEKKLVLRGALLSIFRKSFPEANLFLVGSSCNGFATNSSDADFCLMLTQDRKVDQKYEAMVYLRNLQKLLKSCEFIRKLQVIRAKVPILKFSDTISGCECDVNINNSVGIRNTHLLRTYSRIDSRVRPMLMIVKKWAKSKGINDASKGTLSSYSLSLMVLHFLQCGCKPQVLPSLQQEYPEYFSENIDLNRLPMFDPADHIPCDRSENRKSIGELLLAFFEYFGVHFRWDFLAVSVRLGRALPKALKNDWRYTFICIEEPFEQSNTARAVHQPQKFELIKNEFAQAYENLKAEPSLPTLLS